MNHNLIITVLSALVVGAFLWCNRTQLLSLDALTAGGFTRRGA